VARLISEQIGEVIIGADNTIVPRPIVDAAEVVDCGVDVGLLGCALVRWVLNVMSAEMRASVSDAGTVVTYTCPADNEMSVILPMNPKGATGLGTSPSTRPGTRSTNSSLHCENTSVVVPP